MKTEFLNNVTRSLNKVGLKIQKHSPEILVVAGVIGTVATVVMACKATLKVNEVLDEAKDTIETIHDTADQYANVEPTDEDASEGIVYTQEDMKKDLTITYAKTGWNLVKLYGPAVVTGALSIGCFLASNNILHKRNIALGTSLAAVSSNFKDYRGRVIERFGKEMDQELRYNIKAREIEERVVDEDGNETVVTRTVKEADPSALHNLYSIVWCEGNTGWTKSPELNKYFLLEQQNYANDRLKRKGYLCLNDVYEMLGAQTTNYGQIAGWVYTEDGSAGDNYVDFGMFDTSNPKAADFVNGYEKSIVLDFNCIGNILDHI